MTHRKRSAPQWVPGWSGSSMWLSKPNLPEAWCGVMVWDAWPTPSALHQTWLAGKSTETGHSDGKVIQTLGILRDFPASHGDPHIFGRAGGWILQYMWFCFLNSMAKIQLFSRGSYKTTWCFRLLLTDLLRYCTRHFNLIIKRDQASKSDQVFNLNSDWKWETESIWVQNIPGRFRCLPHDRSDLDPKCLLQLRGSP